MIEYQTLKETEIDRKLFSDFIRRQVVTKCLRKENGKWAVKDAPFIDDWTENDYNISKPPPGNHSSGRICIRRLL